MGIDTCYIIRRYTYHTFGMQIDEVGYFCGSKETEATAEWERLIKEVPLNPEIPEDQIESTRFILSLCLETDEHQDHVTIKRLKGTM